MKFSQWPLHVLSIELRKILYYRVDFWINFVGGAGCYIVVFYFLWKAVFAATGAQTMGGFTFDEMVLYYTLVPLVDRTVRGNEMGTISPEIYDGTMTRYLVYPIPMLGYKYMAHIAVGIVGYFQIILGFGIYFLIFKLPPRVHLDFFHVMLSFIAIGFASALSFFLVSSLDLVAFWADNVWSLLVMLRFVSSILGGSLLPLSLFPPWFLKMIKVLPFAYLTYFPVQTFTGKVDLRQWVHGIIILALWTIVFWAVCRLLLKRGLYRYTGVGI